MSNRITLSEEKKKEMLYKSFLDCENPSNGNVRIARVQGHAVLNGSLCESGSWIELTISRGESYVSFGEERHTSRNELIKVLLTNAQFSELITTMNIGTGVPSTIASVSNIPIPNTYKIPNPSEAIIGEVDGEVTQTFDDVKVELSKLKKSGVTPKQKKEAIEKIEFIMERFKSNEEFYQKQFVRKLEKIDNSRKSEIEGFIATVAHKLGIEQLVKKFANKMLSNDK